MKINIAMEGKELLNLKGEKSKQRVTHDSLHTHKSLHKNN
jgi:hypothetical protein